MSLRCTAAALLVESLAAHDLYLRPATFQPQPGQTLRVEYHNGDSFPESQATTKIERLRDAQLIDARGANAFTNLRVEGTATVADVAAPASGTFVLTSRTMPNFIRLDAGKFKEYLHHEGLDEVIAWRNQHGESGKPGRELYSKYVKALGFVGSAAGGFDKPSGLTLEFIPLANPYTLKPGEPLPVRVLYRGQPKAGLRIEVSHSHDGKISKRDAGRTDPNGEIRIPLASRGLWKLHTIAMERRSQPDTEWESFWASLTFELP